MRRYKLAAHILVILSVFYSVSVLAAPIAVHGAREAWADAADKGELVAVLSEKRGQPEGDSSLGNSGPVVHHDGSSDTGSMESISLSGPEPTPAESASISNQEFKWSPNTEIEPWTPDTEIEPWTSEPSSPKVPPPIGQTPTEEPEQPKGVLKNLADKAKGFWSKLSKVSKSLFREMLDSPMQIRSSATDGGAMNAAQRESQGTYVSTSFLSHKYSDLTTFLSVTL